MHVALYQSSCGEMVLLPACLSPSKPVTRQFNRLFRRDEFEISDADPAIGQLIDPGFLPVTAAQLAALRGRDLAADEVE